MAKIPKYSITKYFTKYSTTPTVTVYNPIIAILYFTLVITAFSMYFASIDFNLRKLYQRECPVQGTTLSYIKGVASTENISETPEIPASYRKRWDVQELVFPAYGGEGETGSFTVVTNMQITENQTLGKCSGNSWFNDCKNDDDCTEGTFQSTGVVTGKCIQDTGKCEIEGWCPTKSNRLPWNGTKPLLEDVKNFVVILRSIVEFPKCGEQQGYNLFVSDIRKNCMYDPIKHPLCPRFRIGDLVKWSNVNFTKAAVWGNVFRIRIKWDCDFDFGWTTNDCLPKYAFSTVKSERNAKVTIWRFQLPQYNNDGSRTQKTLYGFKFLINVEGRGRKFNFFTFIINLGASTGLLFVAPFVCDLILSLFEKCGKSRRVSAKEKSLAADAPHTDTISPPTTAVQIE